MSTHPDRVECEFSWVDAASGLPHATVMAMDHAAFTALCTVLEAYADRQRAALKDFGVSDFAFIEVPPDAVSLPQEMLERLRAECGPLEDQAAHAAWAGLERRAKDLHPAQPGAAATLAMRFVWDGGQLFEDAICVHPSSAAAAKAWLQALGDRLEEDTEGAVGNVEVGFARLPPRQSSLATVVGAIDRSLRQALPLTMRPAADQGVATLVMASRQADRLAAPSARCARRRRA